MIGVIVDREEPERGRVWTGKWNGPVGKEDGTRIFVARYRPRYFRKGDETWDEWCKKLAPSRELHAAWYGKHDLDPIPFDEFILRYRAEMELQQGLVARLAVRVVRGETITFLCYCDDESRCHRTLLKAMVESHMAEAYQKK